ncbi:MAG: hypothetical protein HYZ09_03480 [Candidatus Kerfeldbacteria bacterium]|nr:hypothetical protein [Candidatus Kerfeldbacteria bacterium]
MNALRIYRQLLKRYGPQHWWPITGVDGSRQPPPKPMTEAAAFEIAIGAILTQNTSWRNVEHALVKLKQTKRLTPRALLNTPQAQLAQHVRPSGYYNEKAKKLKVFAAFVATRGKGRLLSLATEPTMALRDELLAVHGIGRETADSILLYALGKPIFVIDAYTKRLCASKGVFFDAYDDYRQFFERALPRRVVLYQEFHALIVRWGVDERTGTR